MSERELIERIQRGDTEAFRELYDAYARLIYRYIVARVGNHHDAEDLTAETFAKAWKGMSSFRWRGVPISAWLFRIAYNLIADKYKRKRDFFNWLPWHHSAQEQHIAQIEHQDEIQRGFATLSYEQQVILYLHFFEGYSLEEVAETLGKSSNAVRVAKFRALRQLREVMQNAKP